MISALALSLLASLANPTDTVWSQEEDLRWWTAPLAAFDGSVDFTGQSGDRLDVPGRYYETPLAPWSPTDPQLELVFTGPAADRWKESRDGIHHTLYLVPEMATEHWFESDPAGHWDPVAAPFFWHQAIKLHHLRVTYRRPGGDETHLYSSPTEYLRPGQAAAFQVARAPADTYEVRVRPVAMMLWNYGVEWTGSAAAERVRAVWWFDPGLRHGP